ncbi:unnamed protein product [Lactuca saligna]|uniref:Cytochrome P450 n=1 Tax=Lactuca saligna TaxID=75948 RepID=A0AA36EMS0_LACSI|nr:unnamed protein product [Lactuca saligna]
MVATVGKVLIAFAVTIIVTWGWKVLYWAWLKPKKLEKLLRKQGYKGNSYKFLIGDIVELATMVKEARSKSIHPISHDISSHVMPFDHHVFNKYGKKSYIWFGPNPRIFIMDPELIKEILSRPDEFQKPHPEAFRDSIVGGIVISEGHKWETHRQIISPAFNVESMKSMFTAICSSCSEMIKKWELLTGSTGMEEVDVWPYIDDFAGDVISRTAFSGSFEEGKKIFQIQKEQMDLAIQLLFILYLPGARYQ